MKCDYCKKDCVTTNRHETDTSIIKEHICPKCAIDYAIDTTVPRDTTAPEYLNAIKQIVADLESHDLICYLEELREMHSTLEDILYDMHCEEGRRSVERVTDNT